MVEQVVTTERLELPQQLAQMEYQIQLLALQFLMVLVVVVVKVEIVTLVQPQVERMAVEQDISAAVTHLRLLVKIGLVEVEVEVGLMEPVAETA
jgi:hypothetical protein